MMRIERDREVSEQRAGIKRNFPQQVSPIHRIRNECQKYPSPVHSRKGCRCRKRKEHHHGPMNRNRHRPLNPLIRIPAGTPNLPIISPCMQLTPLSKTPPLKNGQMRLYNSMIKSPKRTRPCRRRHCRMEIQPYIPRHRFRKIKCPNLCHKPTYRRGRGGRNPQT